MTRTDVMASSRPQALDAAPIRKGPSGVLRRLAVVPAVLLLAIALAGPTTALAAGESTSGYNQEPNKPGTTTTTTTPTPTTPTPTTPTPTTTTTTPPAQETTPTSTETSPTKSSETSPSSTTSTSPEAKKAATLPFTGFDLRWSIGMGLLLVGAGFSIVAMQRRQGRRDVR